MPLVQDFVAVAERFEQAGMVLVAGRVAWLSDLAEASVAPAELRAVEFGAPRSVEHALIVPLHWETENGSFTIVDADLRLEPEPPRRSHLGFSGTYETPSLAGSHDAVNRQHFMEASVRRFITAVAATLERGGADVHAITRPGQ